MRARNHAVPSYEVLEGQRYFRAEVSRPVARPIPTTCEPRCFTSGSGLALWQADDG